MPGKNQFLIGFLLTTVQVLNSYELRLGEEKERRLL